MENQSILSFEEKVIRKVWHLEQWFLVVNDVIQLLTDTNDVKSYWKNLTRKDEELRKGRGTIYTPLSVDTEGGKQKMNCANTEGVLRIVMSISSPKVEPLKLWLAQVGRERIEETENPELLRNRQAEIYRAKGYNEDWIAKRLQTIDTRNELTEEWKKRSIKEGHEYSILTATIAKGAFGLTPNEHGNLKGLDKQNLRDHMTPIELILTAFSEEATRLLAIDVDAQGFHENHETAVKGGQMAGEARERLESQLKTPVVSSQNYLQLKDEGTLEGLEPEDLKI